METNIQIFENSDFGSVRTLVNEENGVQFCLKDVCAALELDGRQVVRRLDKGVVSKHSLKTGGGTQLATFVNEDGLYDVILDSRKPSARAFRKWVTSEVLPQIRKTGGYIPTRNMRTGEALTEAEIVLQADRIMQRTIQSRNLPADNCFTATEVAKGLGMEVNDLNHYLVDHDIIRWKGGRYHLRPAYAELGYAESRVFNYRSCKGEPKERSYMVWTPAGRAFIEGFFYKEVAA